MTAIIFDTETTGTNEPHIIEAAWVRVNLIESKSHVVDDQFWQLYKPGKAIEIGAMATHHIMDEDLVSCPPYTDFRLPNDIQYLIGHNVDFDWMAAQASGPQPECKRIDTLALCRKLWPEADSHKQTAMLYLLDRDRAREMCQNAHRAVDDVHICALLLSFIIRKLGGVSSWDELWEHSERARIPVVMPFGKHKGMLIREVPGDYKLWLLRQPDVDPYLVKALRGETA